MSARLRFTWSIVLVAALSGAVADPSWAAGGARLPVVTAKAAILVDNATGKVIWANNPDEPLPPASTTKIVTAMLALQSGRLDESFSVTDEASQEPPSKISLRSGWRVRLNDLVYALLMNSANDAAVVIAEGLADSVRQFAAKMNVHAYALGASNTHFVNPNGLPAEDHYTTARDLATLFSHGLENPQFREILNTTATSFTPTEGSRRVISLHTKNRLLNGYPIKVIGKTGWTRAAGKCFVGAGMANGREVIVAVLGSTDLWGDLRRLIDFGFGAAPMPQPRNSPQSVMASAAAALGASPAYAASGDADDDRRYLVHVATFRTQAQALTLKKSIQGKGFSTRIIPVRQNRKPAFKVSIGSFESRQSAERAVRKLRSAYPKLKPVISDS